MRRTPHALAAGWEQVLVVGSLVASALAIWLTVRAGFLTYPGWLAAQKADFILGPILVGLYWHNRRPNNRLGLLLIALGLLGVVYILESATGPVLFGIGRLDENAIYLLVLAVILAFPNGRLDGPAVWLILAVGSAVAIAGLVLSLTVPSFAPGFTISGCRTACPANGLAIWPPPSWVPQLVRYATWASVAVAVATACLLLWRFVKGTPPRRRALAIGAPIALVYLLVQASSKIVLLLDPAYSASMQPVNDALQWAFVGARAAIWYGFLFALIAAELYAGRVLRTLVAGALRRPSIGDLEGMLREPLGDPELRLGFWHAAEDRWVDTEGSVLEPTADQTLSEFRRSPDLAVTIAHDPQLSEDPELLEAAAEIALLALEHTQLDAAQKQSLAKLTESRARLAQASDRERRRLERDLHDGAQQRLSGIQIKLGLAMDRVADAELAEELEDISVDAAEAADELRALSHGIYPTVLRSAGLVQALRALAMRATIPIAIVDEGIGRLSPSLEAAIYFCCSEAIQNAIKHAGDGATVTVTLERDGDGVKFTIVDDGVGMQAAAAADGDGLIGMRDRIGAEGGELKINSSRDRGTTVRGSIPMSRVPAGAGAR